MVRPGKTVLISILVTLAGLALGACSSDAPEPPPHGPKDLAIGVSTIAEAGKEYPTTKSDGNLLVDNCSTGLSAEDPIPLLVWIAPGIKADETTPALGRLGDFELQPPGQACSSGDNCGWLVITATSDAFCANTEPCQRTIQIQSIHSPLRLELPSTAPSSELDLSVELRDSTGAPVLADDGKPLHADAAVTVEPSACAAAQ